MSRWSWNLRRLLAGVASFWAFACCAAGCGGPTATRSPDGPATPAMLSVSAGSFGSTPSRVLVTPNYLIETTIDDPAFIRKLPQLMEGAFGQYRKLIPGLPPTDRPLQCFVFANRNQWAQFTEAQTGDDAKVYLRINRGGYTIRDWYVSYYIGDRETYSVAAHEGFHQYVGRHFKRRPPPFLEEGLAALFEYVDWEEDLPRWRLDVNPNRINGLQRSLSQGLTMPLADLCTMHAGQVVSGRLWRVETFYAQAWALARFLTQEQYRPALQAMLSDLAADQVPIGGFDRPDPPGMWNPRSARPLLEHYLGKPLEQIDQEYQDFMRDEVARAYRADSAH